MHANGRESVNLGEAGGWGAWRLSASWLRGVSLVEMIVVLGIATALVGTSVAVYGAFRARAKQLQAGAELALLRNGLESFRLVHGEYPLTGDSPNFSTLDSLDATTAEVKLFNALSGRLDARLRPAETRPYVDFRQLATAHAGAGVELGGSESTVNAFTDPWGNPYVYRYRGSAVEVWRAASCLLYSLGPDGRETPPDRGTFDPNAPLNRDNIHG